MGGTLWRLVAWRLRRRLPADRVEPILVDLLEDYARKRDRSGALRSALWLLVEVRSLLVAYRDQKQPNNAGGSVRLEALWRDVRFAARSLTRTPTATVTILLTLGIGIGSNTAIFAMVHGVVLQPLRYPEAHRLVSIAHRGAASSTDIPSAPYLYFTYRDSAQTLENVGLWQAGTSTVTGFDRPEEVSAVFVTHEILHLLGVPPAAGRAFSAEDDRPEAPATVVLAWSYWQRRFGGDAAVIGRSLEINGMPRRVIGVLPQTFSFIDRPVEIFLPLQLDPAQVTLGRYVFPSLARLKPGVSVDDATADLARVVPRAIDRFPPPPGYTRERFAQRPVRPHVIPLKDDLIGGIGRMLWVLLGATAVVLIIACANVTHLFIVRADARRNEVAVRVALGASPRRIVGGALVEGLLLGLAGGAAGIAIAHAALRWVLASAPYTLPRAAEIAIDPVVVMFHTTLSIAAGVTLGLVTAVRLARGSGGLRLADGGGRTVTESRDRQRARNALVVAQVALALVLLVGSGLMLRTFQTLTRVEPGFVRPAEVQLVSIAATMSDPDETTRTQHQIADALAALPGVTAVGFGDRPPLGADNSGNDTVLTVERSVVRPADGQARPLRRFAFISPGYVRTLGIAILGGRDFNWADLHEGRQVALVSAALARQEWGSPESALGQRVQITPADPWREIVGVVGDLHDNGLLAPAPPIIYFPARVEQFWGAPRISFGQVTFAIRSSRAGHETFVREIEQAVTRVNASLPIGQVRRLSDVHRAALAPTSFTLTTLLLAGGMGLLLGIIGMYGVTAHVVSQRTREIGLRLALGARPDEVTRLFLRRGVVLAAAGLIIGLSAASLLSRAMTSLLFGVAPVDALTYGIVALIVLVVVTCAAYVPARRAARRSPIDVLRS